MTNQPAAMGGMDGLMSFRSIEILKSLIGSTDPGRHPRGGLFGGYPFAIPNPELSHCDTQAN